eukprot:1588972-Amphidinium_carterae.1
MEQHSMNRLEPVGQSHAQRGIALTAFDLTHDLTRVAPNIAGALPPPICGRRVPLTPEDLLNQHPLRYVGH